VTLRDEPTLLTLALAGDHAAFADLVMPHQAHLRALVAFYVPHASAVVEVVQDALVDAFTGLHTFEAGREFGPWLRTLCRNRARRWLRDRARNRLHGADFDHLVAAIPDAADHDSMLPRLQRCLEHLDPRQRALLHARYVAGDAVQELARARKITPNALSMLLLRLKTTLRTCIERQAHPG
jgi:RNA polymerase sigma-70 factor, ECF subfamily